MTSRSGNKFGIDYGIKLPIKVRKNKKLMNKKDKDTATIGKFSFSAGDLNKYIAEKAMSETDSVKEMNVEGTQVFSSKKDGASVSPMGKSKLVSTSLSSLPDKFEDAKENQPATAKASVAGGNTKKVVVKKGETDNKGEADDNDMLEKGKEAEGDYVEPDEHGDDMGEGGINLEWLDEMYENMNKKDNQQKGQSAPTTPQSEDDKDEPLITTYTKEQQKSEEVQELNLEGAANEQFTQLQHDPEVEKAATHLKSDTVNKVLQFRSELPGDVAEAVLEVATSQKIPNHAQGETKQSNKQGISSRVRSKTIVLKHIWINYMSLFISSQ